MKIPTIAVEVRIEDEWVRVAKKESGDVEYCAPFRAFADHATVPVRIVEDYGSDT